MDKLAENGAIVAGKKDRDGDIMWKVTDVGLEEAKRVDFWHYGKSVPEPHALADRKRRRSLDNRLSRRG